jgi:uncharacterized protein YkwD
LLLLATALLLAASALSAQARVAQARIAQAHVAHSADSHRHLTHARGRAFRHRASHRRTSGHKSHAMHGDRATRNGRAHGARVERRHRHRSATSSPAGAQRPASAPAGVTQAGGKAAQLAAILRTPCADTQLTPTQQNIQAVTDATLCLVNQERARNGVLPLQLNAQLEQAAIEHSEEMVSQDFFAHVSPNGSTPLERVRASGYIPNDHVGYTIGENIAWGTLWLATPAAIVAAWIASPEHLANILDAEYRDTAVGVIPAVPASLAQGQPGAIYSQTFGVIVSG